MERGKERNKGKVCRMMFDLLELVMGPDRTDSFLGEYCFGLKKGKKGVCMDSHGIVREKKWLLVEPGDGTGLGRFNVS